jgi:hypothetical protein
VAATPRAASRRGLPPRRALVTPACNAGLPRRQIPGPHEQGMTTPARTRGTRDHLQKEIRCHGRSLAGVRPVIKRRVPVRRRAR